MKKLFHALVTLTAICSFASCDSGDNKKLTLDYLPVQPRNDAKWGFVGPNGKMLYEDEFKEIPSMVINGVFTVEEDGGISVYEATAKKPTLIPGLEELVDAGIMNDGVIPIVRKNERIKLVDKSGKEKLVLDDNVCPFEIIGIEACSTDGMFIIQIYNECFGVINTSGKLLINTIFTDITYLSDNRFLGKSIKGDYLLLNNKGKEIAKFDEKMTAGSKFIKGKCLVLKGDDKIPGYINRSGEFTKLPAKIHRFTGVFDGKVFGFETEDENTGIMSVDGEVIIRPKYKMVAQIPDDKYIVSNDDDQWFILNKNGEKETVLDDFEYIIPMSATGFGGKFELIGAEKRHRIDLYDYKGKAITQESFYNANLQVKKFVKSDYFSPEDIGRTLAYLIDSEGVNGVKFNTPVSRL
ncbi:MAG: WG repeat-containing protein, partial [Muribaculaceae bacterium]|nr:WG repeat-containing protein [Muribaculaceae bacterium]